MTIRLKTPILTILISVVLVSLLVVAHIYRQKISKVAIPFLMAMVITYIFKPIINKFEGKIPKNICIVCIYIAIILIVISFAIIAIPQIIGNIIAFVDAIPSIAIKYQTYIARFLNFMQSKNWPPSFKAALFHEMQNAITTVQTIAIALLKDIISHSANVFSAIMDLALSMIIAYYLIKDSETFKSSMLWLFPRRYKNRIMRVSKKINIVLENFIRGQLLTMFILGAIETLGLYLLKVKYPLLLGILGGIANIIPFFGPIISAVPAVLIAFMQPGLKFIWVILFFIIVQQIDNTFISPHIVEGKLGLHPITTILAILVGGEFFGIIGVLIAVPTVAIIKIFIIEAMEMIV